MAGEWPIYTAFLRGRRCVACGRPGPCIVHHHTNGDVVAPGKPRPAKVVGSKRGKSQRAHDAFGMPLHDQCHTELHNLSGRFKGWTGEELQRWQDAQVSASRAAYVKAMGRDPNG